MLKRWITILILMVVASACSFNTKTQDNPVVEKDLLVSTATPTTVVPTEAYTETPAATNTPIPTESPVPSLTPIQANIAVGPDNFPPDVNPLTGLQVQDVTILERRPVSVKIQIFPRGQRPPMGVGRADIVYDYYQNTGMTRFHAIFYGENSEQVGPIRSGRLFDKELVQVYKSYLVLGSADQRILNTYYRSDMGDRLIQEWSGKCPPMCRIDPNGSNMLVTDTAAVSTYASENRTDNVRQNLNGMTFNSQPLPNGMNATQIAIRFSISAYNRWDYDPTSGRYLRFQDTQETTSAEDEVLDVMVDKNTSEQLVADNVVVLFVPHARAFNSKAGNNEIVDIKLDGSGPAYAFRDGLVYEVQWNRPENDSVVYLTLPDGSPYAFKPGKTWFEVIGQTSTMSTSEDGSTYRFEWALP